MLLKLILLIGAVCAENPGWTRGTSYIYAINSHSITSLNGNSCGIISKGKLLVNVKQDGGLVGKVMALKYHEVTNNNLPAPNELKLSLLTEKMFEIEMENGVIREIIVERSTRNWEANILKSILSQLQLNTNAANLIDDPMNVLSKERNSGVFKAMEETVTGRMETLYNINTSPEDEKVLEVTKHKNYAKMQENIQYHYGLFETDAFLMRNSFSRALLEGNLMSYTIRSSYTINELFVKPTLTDVEDVKMECSMNLTLEEARKTMSGEELQFSGETTPLGGLSYSYIAPFGSNLVSFVRSAKRMSKTSIVDDPEVPLLPLIKRSVNYDIQKHFGEVFDRLHAKTDNSDEYLLLTELMRAMNFAELESVCEKYSHSSVFLGALAQCGSGPSFLIIESLILMRKVNNVQGSVLLSQFSSNVRQPTDELIRVYYKFVLATQSHALINQTALLAFADLVRNVYVHDKVSESRFPTHVFGKFNTAEGKRFVQNELVPFLSGNLHEALKINDLRKSHVFIRAMGNTGHPRMLKTFEGYLEGRQFATDLQRLWMVVCMDKLVETFPQRAQAVLYRIYRNVGEVEEIRVAAVYLLMKTRPLGQMLHTIADYTNHDASEQVNAAIKSSIELAASLGDDDSDFRWAAENAKVFLTKKEYSKQYSSNNLKTFIYGQLRSFLAAETIVGDLVDGFKLSFKNNLIENLFRVESFNTDEIWRRFKQLIDSRQEEEFNRIEGLLNVHFGDISALISFDNSTLSALPEAIQRFVQGLRPEIEINQWFNPRQITVAFPTETGLPCIYTYDSPFNVHLKGTFKGEMRPPLSNGRKLFAPSELQGNLDYTFTLQQRIQGKLSILTPFDGKMRGTTYAKSARLYMPLKTSFQCNLKEKHLKIEIVPKEELLNTMPLLHFSTKAFNSNSSLIDSPTQQLILTHPRVNSFEKTFGGEENGMTFALRVKQEGNRLDTLFSDRIMYRDVNFHYDAARSTNKNVVIKLGEKIAYKTEPTNSHNVLKYLKNYLSFIKDDLKYHNMHIGIYDLSVQFRGDANVEYILKLVCGRSNLDPKSILLVEYLKKEKRVLADRFTVHVSNYIPNTNEINFNYSLYNPPIIYSNVQLFYGVKKNANSVQADVKLERSEKRTEYLRNASVECGRDDLFATKCTRLFQSVNLLDKISVDINYRNITEEFGRFLNDFYSYYRGFFNFKAKTGKNDLKLNQIAFQALFAQDLNSLTASFQTQDDRYEINDVFVNDFLKELILVHPVHGFRSRLYSKLRKMRSYHPVCGVGLKEITTFSERVYPVAFDDRWTVLFKYAPRYHQSEEYTILIRHSGDLAHKDVKLTVRTPQTRDQIEINLFPQWGADNSTNLTAQLLINGKFAANFSEKTYDLNNGYIQIYNLPNGELKTRINDQFYLVSDGFNVKLTLIDQKYRKNVHGLCGRFNGNKMSDCLTLNNCITLNAAIFTDTYAINSNKTLVDCIKSRNVFGNVVTSNDWATGDGISPCLDYKSVYVRRNSQLCFTIRPVLYLKRECKYWRYSNRYVAAFCSNTTEQIEFYKNAIDKGNRLDFTAFPATDNVEIQVPDVDNHDEYSPLTI